MNQSSLVAIAQKHPDGVTLACAASQEGLEMKGVGMSEGALQGPKVAVRPPASSLKQATLSLRWCSEHRVGPSLLEVVRASMPWHAHAERSPRMRRASWMSLGMIVTRLAWMAQRLVSSKRPTR